LVVSVIVLSIVFCIISGFYFLGQGYPDTTQTITQDEVTQKVTKGGD
jgi:hypothetical protein